jgi:hypothetical protein
MFYFTGAQFVFILGVNVLTSCNASLPASTFLWGAEHETLAHDGKPTALNRVLEKLIAT